jgi:hypothetical protein
MKLGLRLLAALALIAGAACSSKDESPDKADSPSPTVAAPTANPGERPGQLPSVNLAFTDLGGAVEEVTGNYGPGFTGRRLIDGLLKPAWIVDTRMKSEQFWLTYPQEAVISFFEREPAEIDAVTIVFPDPATFAPKDIEILTSMTSATENFARRATATLEAKPGETTIEFDAVEAKFVKLKILSGYESLVLEIAEIRVREANRTGYTPLFVRAPMVKHWKGSPREAAQRGLDWLQHAAPTWVEDHGCFGCHVQSQVLMGQAVALKHGYRVNMRSVRLLEEHVRGQSSWGSWWNPSNSATAFGAMGAAYAADMIGSENDKAYPYTQYGLLGESTRRLMERQEEDGAFPVDEVHPPIVQGRFMTTANALVAIKRQEVQTGDSGYAESAGRGLEWIATHESETTQDKIFKIIALMHYGTPDQKRLAWSVVETLASEQQQDGGWKETSTSAGSNAFATGQVLYAFKQAGISIHGEMFRRGVDFLLGHQDKDPESPDNGSWKAMNTESKQPSGFAHTMWAVIGLAGAYGPEPTGALQIVKQQGDKPPARNLVIVLDVSGSMNAKLGDTTRWKTALDMIKEVVDALPEDLNVGLRVYGHRQSSKSPQTCKDTELVVPIERLDRAKILKAASRLKPRGETPLIHSGLQAVEDLKAAGGGSVVLITDGEESCKGDAKQAAVEIAASGVDVTLNIVGFTLTGEEAQAELGALAGSTGGRYYAAQDGAQLSRAVKLAALNRLPYDILDGTGKVLVSGQTSELSRELPPGKYRIRVDALGQILEESLTIAPNKTTALGLGVENDRFVIQRQGDAR